MSDLRQEAVRAATPETRAPAAAKKDTGTTRIREAMAKNATQSPVEAFAAAVEGIDVVDRGAAQAVVIENIGTEIDSTTGKKTLNPEQTRLKTKAEKFEKISGLLLEKGFDSTEFAPYQAEALQTVEGILSAFPEIAALIPDGTANPAAKKAFLESYLKDPRFIAIVRRRYNEAFAETRTLEDPVTQAVTDFEAANKAFTDNETSHTKATTRVGELHAILDRFKPTGADAATLDTLGGKLDANRGKLHRAERELDRIDDRMGSLEVRKAIAEDRGDTVRAKEAEDEIKALETRRGIEEGKLTDIAKEIKEFERLNAEKTAAQEELARQQAVQAECEGKKDALARDKALKQATLEQARKQRVRLERGYVKSLDVLGSSVAEYQQERLREAEAARIEVAEKDEAEAKDKAQKALASQRRRRWKEAHKPNAWNRETEQLNKGKIEEDLMGALSQDPDKGPDPLVKDMLVKGLATEVAAGNMTQAEADAIVAEKMKDPDFMKDARPQVMEDLLAVAFRSGQKLNNSQLEQIAESEWGVGLIDRALNKNAELKAMLEKARADGVIKGDLRTFFKDNPSILAIILAAAAGTVGIAVGAPLIAAAGLGSAAGGGAFKAMH
jgi:hypothetical protein